MTVKNTGYRRCRSLRQKLFWTMLILGMSLAMACTYDSQLQDATCDSDVDCEGNAVCEEGYCIASDGDVGPDADDCQGDESLCDGECVDLDTDPNHCGACGNDCPYDPGDSEPWCDQGTCNVECIDDEFTACSGECVDIDTDLGHCGGCDDVCEVDGGTTICSGGVCEVDACDGERVDCSEETDDESPYCADTDSDPEHCGGCGNDCAEEDVPNHAVHICDAGSCDWECDEGYFDCAGECQPEDGGFKECGDKCVNTDTDEDHCGECDKVCPGIEFCDDGSCTDECDDGQQICDNQCFSDEDFDTDPDHCGGCDQPCEDTIPENAYHVCENGDCDWECDSDFEQCDNQCFSGDDFDTDPDHCGGCDQPCEDTIPENAHHVCENGDCNWECDSDFEQCDNQCFSDDDFDDDINHCGGCENECDPPANATAQCEEGVCEFECDASHQLCDGECIPDSETCDDCDPDHSGDFGGGDGTVDNPYLLCTADHIDEIDHPHNMSDHFVMTQTITVGDGVAPIGTPGQHFEGTFDGAGHSLENLELDGGDDTYGLFRELDEEGKIIDLTLTNITVEGGEETGALVGVNHGSIESVHLDGGTVEGETDVGGLVGVNSGDIHDSSTKEIIVDADAFAGGLAGNNGGYINRSKARDIDVNTQGVDRGGTMISDTGGLVGQKYWRGRRILFLGPCDRR